MPVPARGSDNDGVRGIEIGWAIALWGGVAATLFATGLIAGALRAGWTSFDPIRTLGCIIATRPDSGMALAAGSVLHLILGSAVFPAVYAVIFELLGRADALTGAVIGGIHGSIAGLCLPAFVARTRCGRARRAPDPGIFARKLGTLTPVGILSVHAIYGAVLGFIYVVPA